MSAGPYYSALAEHLALPQLYRGMSQVANAVLVSLEAHLGAAPGSISGLVDAWEDGSLAAAEAPG
jgi:hypothetical protein